MRILVDLNLPPAWVATLRQSGFEAVHWSTVGDARATDAALLAWAAEHEHVVFTHDLDFGAILAASGARTPSVIQVRTQDVTPEHLARLVVTALPQHERLLEQGALITVDEARSRARILPLKRD
ncbi:MAG: DUF5615 family PIN-like protein [Gammaproteobacteria bacterium]|nr:DUF5615 family PIN-like protein [Gammaproteobacteria bacterium]